MLGRKTMKVESSTRLFLKRTSKTDIAADLVAEAVPNEDGRRHVLHLPAPIWQTAEEQIEAMRFLP